MDFRPHVRFAFDGKTYEYHGEGGYADLLLLKQNAGLSILQFFNAIIVGDVQAVLGLVLLAKRHAGELVTWDGVAAQMVGDNSPVHVIESIEPIEAPVAPAKATKRKSAAEPVEDEPQAAEPA